MTELSDLPPPARIQRYRDLAADARSQAAMAKDALRESYILMAEQWEKLAAELTATLKSDPGSNTDS